MQWAGNIYQATTWYWRSAGEVLTCAGGPSNDGYSRTYTSVNGVPMSKCVVIVGVEPNTYGAYCVPDYIDGRPVVAIDMSQDYEGSQFNDPDVAPTVKALVFPETLRLVETDTINQCLNLDHIRFAGKYVWMLAEAVPEVTAMKESEIPGLSGQIHDLYICVPSGCQSTAYPDRELIARMGYGYVMHGGTYLYPATTAWFGDQDKFY